METFDDGSILVLIATFVFFAGMAWSLLGALPDWGRVVTGVAAALLAVAALVTLL